MTHLIDKKKELQESLNKPFGGKMNFTPNSFSWLIDDTLSKSSAYFQTQKEEIVVKRLGNKQYRIKQAPNPS